jgi:hypothetical protein
MKTVTQLNISCGEFRLQEIGEEDKDEDEVSDTSSAPTGAPLGTLPPNQLAPPQPVGSNAVLDVIHFFKSQRVCNICK